MKRRLLLVFLALLLPGCAGLDVAKDAWSDLSESLFGKDTAEPPRPLAEDFEAKTGFKLEWKESVGEGYGEQNINLVPAANENSVFAADLKGLVEAHTRLGGAKLWEVETELPFSAGPVLSKDKLILGTRDGEVAAFSLGDGSLIWKSPVSSTVLALPAVGGGVVVVRSNDGRLTGLDEKSGTVLWTHERSAPLPLLAVRSKGGPVVADDLVLDGFGGGKLSALRLKDGRQEWEALVALPHGRSEVERMLDINAVPVVRDDTIYVSGYQGGVAAVALKDGEVQWRQEKIYTYSGLSSVRRALFLADGSSDVWRLELRGGNDLWKQEELHQRRLTMPVPVKDKLVVGDFEGWVHVLSQDDGSLLARVQIDDSPIEAAPVVYDDVVYVYTSGGTLAALTVE